MMESEAQEAEKQWEFYNSRNEHLSILKVFDLGILDLQKELFRGAKNDSEAVTIILNRLLGVTDHLHTRKMVYCYLAHYAQRDGLPKRHFLEMAFSCDLKRYREAGFDEVEILTAKDGTACPECQGQSEKILKVDDALDLRFLPIASCSSKFGCRCAYVPYKKAWL